MKADINEIVTRLNLETKKHGIPEDKKFMKFVEQCFENIEKLQLGLLGGLKKKDSHLKE